MQSIHQAARDHFFSQETSDGGARKHHAIFEAGAEFVQQWYSFEDESPEIPELKDQSYQIIAYRIENGKRRYQAIWVGEDSDMAEWSQLFTHWRPIEF